MRNLRTFAIAAGCHWSPGSQVCPFRQAPKAINIVEVATGVEKNATWLVALCAGSSEALESCWTELSLNTMLKPPILSAIKAAKRKLSCLSEPNNRLGVQVAPCVW